LRHFLTLSVDVTKSVAPAGSAAGRRASPTSRYSRVVGSRARTLAADLLGTWQLKKAAEASETADCTAASTQLIKKT